MDDGPSTESRQDFYGSGMKEKKTNRFTSFESNRKKDGTVEENETIRRKET